MVRFTCLGGLTEFVASMMPEVWAVERGPLMLSPIAVSNCFEIVGGWGMQRNSTMNSFALTFWSVLPSFTRRTPPVNDCAFGRGPFWLFADALLSGGLGSVSATAVEDESSRRKRRPM